MRMAILLFVAFMTAVVVPATSHACTPAIDKNGMPVISPERPTVFEGTVTGIKDSAVDISVIKSLDPAFKEGGVVVVNQGMTSCDHIFEKGQTLLYSGGHETKEDGSIVLENFFMNWKPNHDE